MENMLLTMRYPENRASYILIGGRKLLFIGQKNAVNLDGTLENLADSVAERFGHKQDFIPPGIIIIIIIIIIIKIIILIIIIIMINLREHLDFDEMNWKVAKTNELAPKLVLKEGPIDNSKL